QQAVPTLVMEMYGSYSATASKRTLRASYNLLLDPGKAGYLEILDPSKQLLNSVALNRDQITVYWAKNGTYIQEPATAENLNAVVGLALIPDDLLLLLAGSGLNFSEWQAVNVEKDGWKIGRENFTGRLSLKNNISKIQIQSSSTPALNIIYEDYEEIDTRLLPRKMRFEVPERRLALQLRSEKVLFRDEPSKPELFKVQLPSTAQKVTLKEIYRGKPLLLED
ncbi:MAG TPA: DUF4292 domain-containing protein, partial [Acidobacteriota bacterium]|nr:DUF4292 domain-containing protein [Acidobacteriota bacterium]